jgi:MoxR-like ATPase
MADAFQLLDPADDAVEGAPARRAALEARRIPETLGDHRAGARYFQPSADLVTAVNVALAVGAPLLLTGEPGTGKTQVAYYLERHFGLEDSLFFLPVRSSTTSSDLLYRFDAVAYFHAASDPRRKGEDIRRADFIDKGALWKAYEAKGSSLVLIDEIDKAPRDFPNDLLHVLDQHSFPVPERGEPVKKAEGTPPPLVIITSNSERRLPEPFLRRCIFHHIQFTRALVEKAVGARAGDFPRLDEKARAAAIERFLELRDRGLRKKPATAELLVWLTVLSARGTTAEQLEGAPLRELPAIAALVKDRDDLDAL